VAAGCAVPFVTVPVPTVPRVFNGPVQTTEEPNHPLGDATEVWFDLLDSLYRQKHSMALRSEIDLGGFGGRLDLSVT
jgi:hypothetical protein